MKVKIRRSTNDDLNGIYDLHIKCFSLTDQWYRANIINYLNNGIVVELNNKIIGVLLQGMIRACELPHNKSNDVAVIFDKNPKDDVFEALNTNGELFQNNNLHYNEFNGIVMICIDPRYRSKGLAKKLIEKHWNDNLNKIVCLNTRRSNIKAYSLYKFLGYDHIAYVKDKYFLPNEDAIFMIKDLT